jgi:hypothetical protein
MLVQDASLRCCLKAVKDAWSLLLLTARPKDHVCYSPTKTNSTETYSSECSVSGFHMLDPASTIGSIVKCWNSILSLIWLVQPKLATHFDNLFVILFSYCKQVVRLQCLWNKFECLSAFGINLKVVCSVNA